jgi:hypothetical protein
MLSKSDRFFAVMLKTNGRCWYCGVRIWPRSEDVRNTTVDHLIPLARGGVDGLENCVPACGLCNGSKCANTLDDFRHYAAQRALGMPMFSREQIAWMRKRGVDLTKYDDFRFWYETHKTRHTDMWSAGRIRSEIKRKASAHAAL